MLSAVVHAFPGLRWTAARPVIQRMEDKRMVNAVAVKVGNRYNGPHSRDCHLSAQELNDFIEDTERDWQVRDGRVWFGDVGGAKASSIPSKALIASSLQYANELERIV